MHHPPSPQSVMQFGWIGQTAAVAAGRGAKVENLLLEAGIASRQGHIHRDTWLSPAEYMLMCVLLINSVDDEMHGATRARMRRGTASMGAKVLATGKTLGAAINTLFRFYDIAGGFCAVSCDVEGADAVITIRADGESPSLTAVVEELMATHLHALFTSYLGFLLPLSLLRTSSQDHPNLGGVHPYLKCPTCRGHSTQMVFSSAYLSRPQKGKALDGSTADAMTFWVSRCEAAGDDRPWSEEAMPLSTKLYGVLLGEDLAFEDLCARTTMSPRDVRQGLMAEGTSYRSLRRTALLERVRPHLMAETSTDDIAFALGYSDARSLRRAIKLAGGMSVSDLRLAGHPGVVGDETVIANLRRHMSYME